MPKNKWAKMLMKFDDVIKDDYNPYAEGNYIKTYCPSLNWIFSRSPGLPLGQFLLLWGPPKAGKSIITNLFVSSLHKMDQEAIAIKFDTELRSQSPIEPFWNIDTERFIRYNTNRPEDIFDRILNDIQPLVEQGMPLKLVIIDSFQGIQGIKAAGAQSVTQHQIGDHAMTIQKGLKAIAPFLKKHRIAFIGTEQVRGNLDAGMYGPKEKMGGGWFEKHAFEYYVKVTRNNRKAETHMSVTGEKFESDVKDAKGNKEVKAHKIFVQMEQSSTGVAGRTGLLTFHYDKGFINKVEELFVLGLGVGVIQKPNLQTYAFDGKEFRGKANFVKALEKDEELQNKLEEMIYQKTFNVDNAEGN